MNIFNRKEERLAAERVNSAAIGIERYGVALRKKIKDIAEIDDEPTVPSHFCPYAVENSAAFFSAFAALKIILNYKGTSSCPWKGSVYERCNELFAETISQDSLKVYESATYYNRPEFPFSSEYPFRTGESPYAELAIALRQYYIHWLTLAVYGYSPEYVFYSHYYRKPFSYGPGSVGHVSNIVYQFLSDMGSSREYLNESLLRISDALYTEIYGKSPSEFYAEESPKVKDD